MMQTEGKPHPMRRGNTMHIKVLGPLLPRTTIWALKQREIISQLEIQVWAALALCEALRENLSRPLPAAGE